MAKIFDVVEIGEISIRLQDQPDLTRFIVPIVERSGVEISLQLGTNECRMLWEALEGLRQQYPRAMGIQ